MKKKGFTLIELLVVIAIIALLLSILMPSLHKVKKIAQTVVCSSNMKQLAIGNLLYAAEFDDKIVLAASENGEMWLTTIMMYCEDPDIKICPSARKVAELPENPSSDSTLGPRGGRRAKINEDGTCYESWVAQTPDLIVHSSSYGMNGWAQNPEGAIFMSSYNYEKFYWGKTTVSMTYNIPLIAPDVWRSGYPKGDSSTEVFTNIPGENMGSGIGRFIFIRHDDRNNVAFVDGHVERVYLPEMGLLKWHRKWDPVVFDIPWLEN
jgi:prepilin-type N-terminal cleavage/methylation domain-containing protein/prepilin-type processing-associated H-X9-DG protein